jgi:beta-lactamase regulating signal transducer with metallopeptidase domain
MAIFMIYMIVLGATAALACDLVERSVLLMRRPVRFVWAGGMVATLAVSVIVVGGWGVAPDVTAGSQAQHAAAGIGQATSTSVFAPTILERIESSIGEFDPALGILWLAGSIGIGVLVLAFAARARRIVRDASPGELEGVPVHFTESTGPAIVGIIRYRIVVPRWVTELPMEKQRLIVEHETQHARAFDPLLVWLAAAAIVVFPWNPGLWYMMRRLRAGVELDCDRRVLGCRPDAKAYMTLLVDVVERVSMPRVFAAAITESPSQLQRRILIMSSSKRRFDRARASVLSVAAFVLLGAAVRMPMPSAPAAIFGSGETGQPIATVTVRSQGDRAEAFVVYSSDSALLVAADGKKVVTMRLTTPATFKAELAGGDVHIQSISGDALAVSAVFTGAPARQSAMSADHVMLIRGGIGVRRPRLIPAGQIPLMKSKSPPKGMRMEHEVSVAAEQIPGTGSPVYPAALRASKVEGQVIAQFVLDADGRPDADTFKVLSATNDLFAASVRSALPGMRFKPAELNGRKVRQLIQQAFMFKID